MSPEQLHCARGCLRRDRHLTDCHDDQCRGCQPRATHTGVLCKGCCQHLEQLLGPADDHESLTGACQWLADNIGQHLRASIGGDNAAPGQSSTTGMEQAATVLSVLSDLQIAIAEWHAHFAGDRQILPYRDKDPAALTGWLRPWGTMLAEWEPIADTLDHLLMLMGQAHAVAPWRGQDPAASDQAAVMVWGLPSETTRDVCRRFGKTPNWLRMQKHLGRIEPTSADCSPLWWRPWEVFKLIHPEAAERYEARLANRSARGGDEVVYQAG